MRLFFAFQEIIFNQIYFSFSFLSLYTFFYRIEIIRANNNCIITDLYLYRYSTKICCVVCLGEEKNESEIYVLNRAVYN